MLKKSEYQFDQYLFWVFAFAIPFLPLAKILVSILVGLFIIERIVFFSSAKRFPFSISKKYIYLSILPMLFFVMHLMGMLYTDNIQEGWMDIESKFLFFIFPLVFLFYAPICKNDFFKILNFFIGGCFIICFYLLMVSIQQFLSTKNSYYLFYSGLSKFHHPSYLSMYLNWCIVILIYFLFENLYEKLRSVFVFLLIFFAFFILLLESKTGIAILGIIIITSIAICFVFKKYKTAILISLFMCLGFVAYMVCIPQKSNRILLAIKDVSSQNNKQENSTTSRFIIWENAISILNNNWLLGKGTGDVNQALEEAYKQKSDGNLKTAIQQNFNAHNQYLQTMIALGLIGEFILLACLFIPLYISIKQRDYIYISFILLMAINLFSESMLERQAGIVFFTFFYLLLLKFNMLGNTYKIEVE